MPRINSKQTYIVASCKSWHLKSFRQLKRKWHGRWFFSSHPKSLFSVLKKVQPCIIFFLHWSWLVPKYILEKNECICFHMTNVPYGRGGSPLQNLIQRDHKKTKITALQMVEDLDAGPIYIKRNLSLKGRAEDIYRRASKISVSMILEILKKQPKPFPQKGRVVKFRRRHPEESRLPKVGGIAKWYNWIRMLDAATYPRAFLKFGDFRLEFHSAIKKRNRLEAKVLITQGANKK